MAEQQTFWLLIVLHQSTRQLSTEDPTEENCIPLKLHPTEEKPIVVQNFSSQVYQFSEENVSEQLNSFSRLTAAGLSKMFPEHLLRAVQSTTSDQSQNALRVLTKLVNIGCHGGTSRICFTSSL